jgi:hypothetical protein
MQVLPVNSSQPTPPDVDQNSLALHKPSTKTKTKPEETIELVHCDIIRDQFWTEHPLILSL